MNERALKVLEQYDLEVNSMRRGRGSYILDTPQGIRILSDCTFSERKGLFQNRVMQQVRQGGYEKVDLILANKEGNLISRDWEENRYVVREWYGGRECDTENEQEILAAVGNLARLHLLMRLPEEKTEGNETDTESFRQSFTALSPLQTIRAQNAELKKIRSFVRKKQSKGLFERQFLQDFSFYYEQAEEAQRRLELDWNEQENLTECTDGRVCHGDYDHHHVWMTGDGMATTDFSCCRFDYQVIDLYRFMRKILEKREWNAQLGMRMLEQYTQVRTLPEKERQLLYIRMLYPEKFRKLANYYYGGNKAWISRRYSDKLSMLNRQREKREAFVQLLRP